MSQVFYEYCETCGKELLNTKDSYIIDVDDKIYCDNCWNEKIATEEKEGKE